MFHLISADIRIYSNSKCDTILSVNCFLFAFALNLPQIESCHKFLNRGLKTFKLESTILKVHFIKTSQGKWRIISHCNDFWFKNVKTCFSREEDYREYRLAREDWIMRFRLPGCREHIQNNSIDDTILRKEAINEHWNILFNHDQPESIARLKVRIIKL